MHQGFVATPSPSVTPRPTDGSDPLEYVMFTMLVVLLVLPCLVYCWKIGGLREYCCSQKHESTVSGQADLEGAVSVGAYVGHPGGPHYRLMSHPQILFVHRPSPESPPLQSATWRETAQRNARRIMFSITKQDKLAATSARVSTPSVPLTRIPQMGDQEREPKATIEKA